MLHKHNTKITILKLPDFYTLILKFFWLHPQLQTNNPAHSNTCKIKLHFYRAKDPHLVSQLLGAKTPKWQSRWLRGRTNHLIAPEQDLNIGSTSELWSLVKMAPLETGMGPWIWWKLSQTRCLIRNIRGRTNQPEGWKARVRGEPCAILSLPLAAI